MVAPQDEVEFGLALLADMGMRTKLLEVIACPSCGRADVDVHEFTLRIEAALKELGRKETVSFLGCAVNGPGEAAEADYGIVASARLSTIYRGRDPLKKVANDDLIDEFIKLIREEVPETVPTR
jgi:(E)-4-hydroxy-3-methylbut-2-enyl-diphosphate synthase